MKFSMGTILMSAFKMHDDRTTMMMMIMTTTITITWILVAVFVLFYFLWFVKRSCAYVGDIALATDECI
jgi:hypothetical protein